MGTLKPIRPAAPIRVRYEAKLHALVTEMHRNVSRSIEAEYRLNQPETLLYASDESPARSMQATISKLGRQWLRRFDEMSGTMASYFATSVKDRVDRVMRDSLRRGGLSVRFKMTRAMSDAYAAVRAENVALIKSIASEYLTQVEALVMRSVAQGRDLGTLTEDMTARYGITRRRASRIALHQNNLATTTMRRTRELELGIVEGEWLHSAGGKHPRPPHVAFSRQRFKIADGHDFEDGEGRVLPGQLLGCKCTWRAIVPGFDD